MKCSECKFENLDGMIFCVECGAKLEVVCPECDFSDLPSFKFCGKYGFEQQKPDEASFVDLFKTPFEESCPCI